MQVVITGANRGIGLALAQHYTATGAQVLAGARQPHAGQMALDVTDPAALQAASAQIDGPVDLLICNAGVYLDQGETLAAGYAEPLWAQSFATNVTGVFHTIQAFMPQLRAGRGKIAIISSIMGSSAAASGGSYIYRASKAAVANLGRNLAVDLARDGIAVGIYHPGWVQTDMGGAGASITAQRAATGLAQRFAALSLARSGCFESYDGSPLTY